MALPRERLSHVEQVDDEHERLVRTDDAAGAARPVPQVRRDGQRAPAADPHAGDALIPPLDDLTGSEAEPEWLHAVPGGVELLARRPCDTHVVDADGAPGGRLGTVADGVV